MGLFAACHLWTSFVISGNGASGPCYQFISLASGCYRDILLNTIDFLLYVLGIIFANAFSRLWDPPSTCGPFPGDKATGAWLITHLHLLSRFRICGATPPLPRTATLAWCLIKRRDNFTRSVTMYPKYLHRTGWRSGTALELYSGGA
jgi:hypothetical protein